MHAVPDIIAFLCKNCIPEGRHLPSQWSEAGLQVRVRELPCSGKIDPQYLFHAFEGGVRGICVITCSDGECTLAQGNYRAAVRIGTVRRLLEEIGMAPGRALLVPCPKNESADFVKGLIGDACRSIALSAGVKPAHQGN